MTRFGCHKGTTSDRPFQYDWGTLDRCPLAILRDMSPEDQAAVHWGITRAVAKRQGSLSAYIQPGTLSAQGEALIEIAEDIIHKREIERLEAIRDGGS